MIMQLGVVHIIAAIIFLSSLHIMQVKTLTLSDPILHPLAPIPNLSDRLSEPIFTAAGNRSREALYVAPKIINFYIIFHCIVAPEPPHARDHSYEASRHIFGIHLGGP